MQTRPGRAGAESAPHQRGPAVQDQLPQTRPAVHGLPQQAEGGYPETTDRHRAQHDPHRHLTGKVQDPRIIPPLALGESQKNCVSLFWLQ